MNEANTHSRPVVGPVDPTVLPQIADTETDWPIAKLTIGAESYLIERAALYSPGLPPGDHDVWCVPVSAANELTRLQGERRVLAVWIHRALRVLETLQHEDMEDGGQELRTLTERGAALVAEVLRQNVAINLPP